MAAPSTPDVHLRGGGGGPDMEEQTMERHHGKPYTPKRPIPTIRGYREHRAELEQRQQQRDHDAGTGLSADEQQEDPGAGEDSKLHRAYESVKAIAQDADQPRPSRGGPYPASNRNETGGPTKDDADSAPAETPPPGPDGDGGSGVDEPRPDDARPANEDGRNEDGRNADRDTGGKSATEQVAALTDPREKRKAMKTRAAKGQGGSGTAREVTDPVTHLPATIRDMTEKDLDTIPENELESTTAAGIEGAAQTKGQLDAERKQLERAHRGMRRLFPPPHFVDTKREMMHAYRKALFAGLGAIGVLAVVGVAFTTTWGQQRAGAGRLDDAGWLGRSTSPRGGGRLLSWLFPVSALSLMAGGVYVTILGVHDWLNKRIDGIFEDETWDAARLEETRLNKSGAEMPESVAWLNSLLTSVWPLINPDLFAPLVDTLEDVMQASLPKVIRMVSVDDLGQGSEAIRILGIRWLPSGAAGQSVDPQGNLTGADQSNDRLVPGEGQEDKNASGGGGGEGKGDDGGGNESAQNEQQTETVREGMEAEDGDFINLELAFSYRARSSGRSIRKKAKNAHLYLKFYLPGEIAVPVWVEMRGLVGIVRVRLQLTPDPPFFSLCTLTFMGQPRADMACVPLSRHSLNLMDVPLISGFVQSAIDAALAEYVAPRSLTLDLKEMLVGDDFKKDTHARGVVLVCIKKAKGFKEGDGTSSVGSASLKDGSSDAYVTLAWAKFGKPAAATRVIPEQNMPVWNEWATILVTPDELNAQESLRLQLWDSDKWTADDDLGRVEVSLRELMHDPRTKNKMCDRVDRLRSQHADENMPGTLEWSVGYFSKAKIQECQLRKQTADPDIRTKAQLEERASAQAKDKLRNASDGHDESEELQQQTLQDFKQKEDELMVSAPPPESFPSGILAIQIHNLTGLEVVKLNLKSDGDGDQGNAREDEAEQADDLPDSYCTIVLNHRNIYRTRTKPKTAKPFFNAGTEHFVRDWRTAEVIVSVRDSRERENDALLGIVYLPLRRVFERRSQVMAVYPIAGGIGYGKARISMVWRSVELTMPPELAGWECGTLEVKAPVRVKGGGVLGDGDALKRCKLRMNTSIGAAKMYASDDGWRSKKGSGPADAGDSAFLAVVKRESSPLVIEFSQHSLLSDSTPGLAVLWLSAVPDEEDTTVTLQVWKGGKDRLQRARTCCDYAGLDENEQPLGEIEMVVRFWRGLSGYHQHWASRARNANVRDVMEVLDTVNDERMADSGAEVEDEGWAGGEKETSDDSEDEPTTDGRRDGDKSRSMSTGDNNSSNDSSYQQLPSPESEEREKRKKRKILRRAGSNLSSSSSSSSSSSHSDADNNKPMRSTAKKITSKLKRGSGTDTNLEEDGTRGPMDQVRDYRKHHKQLHRKHRGVMQWKGARTLDWMMDKATASKEKVAGVFEHGEKGGGGVETEV